MSNPIIIGSRGSQLAIWQAEYAQAELKKLGYHSEIRIIHTKGDKNLQLSFDKIEGKGFFTKELEEALLAGEIDLVIHSHKDLATEEVPGLMIGAVSYRDDPADWLIIAPQNYDSTQLWGLRAGAKVGTSSPRRVSQMSYFRHDLCFEPIRGNVTSRLAKVGALCDAVILAAAGLCRLNIDLSGYHLTAFEPWQMIPAPAQGALAYQIRKEDMQMRDVLSSLHHPDVAIAIGIERDTLSGLGAGCQQPVGVFAQKQKDQWEVWCSWALAIDMPVTRFFIKSQDPYSISSRLIALIRSEKKYNVFITREIDARTEKSFAGSSLQLMGRSLLHFEAINSPGPISCDWIFFTSRRAVAFFAQSMQGQKWEGRLAVFGSGTAEAVAEYLPGHKIDFVGAGADHLGVADEFVKKAGAAVSVMMPVGIHHISSIADLLMSSGLRVEQRVVYENKKFPGIHRPEAEIYIFTSPLNVEAFLDHWSLEGAKKIIAIGPSTAAALLNKGISAVISKGPEPWHLAECCYVE